MAMIAEGTYLREVSQDNAEFLARMGYVEKCEICEGNWFHFTKGTSIEQVEYAINDVIGVRG